uniref:Putative ixodes 10 kDa peptide protein n=1 Tax=Ixodes ricinus TaxID=34613 RepID=A0A0K8REY4_IXORI
MERGLRINFLECYRAVRTGGDIFCQICGYDKSKGLDYETCELKCEGGTVDLPEEACSYDGGQKAFDTVPHALIIHKLLTLNLPTNIIAWLTDYLHQRNNPS